jgi:hypothetical protein
MLGTGRLLATFFWPWGYKDAAPTELNPFRCQPSHRESTVITFQADLRGPICYPEGA